MAIRNRIENGVGLIALPDPPQRVEEGTLVAVVTRLLASLRDAVAAINGRLSLGNGAHATRTGNLDGQWIDQSFSNTPDTEAEVFHGLGRAPVGYVVVGADRACRVYDSRPEAWGTNRLFLKCDTASAEVKLFVF